MTKRKMTIILLLLCGLGGCALWIASNSIVHSKSWPAVGDGTEISNPLIRVNAKARAAQKNSGEIATGELVDEMFRLFNFDQAPAGFDDAIKERLVRAEINYRNGHGKSDSSEFRVVHAVNLLADKVGTPSYTRTNVFEVRRLRANLLPYTSDLQTRDDKQDKGKGQKHSAFMSPLEAFFIATSLVQQKRYNVEYQLTNDEWIALHGGKRGAKSNEKFLSEMTARRSDSSRTKEVGQAVKRGFAAMSPSQLLALPDDLLTTLGIER